jgi:hypothetical protein
VIDDLDVTAPARVFDSWRHAVAALTEAERRQAPYVELLALSAHVIRTRNVLALDRQSSGLELPDSMLRHVYADEDLLAQADDSQLMV